jgi:hypothetical protein
MLVVQQVMCQAYRKYTPNHQVCLSARSAGASLLWFPAEEACRQEGGSDTVEDDQQ